jgi:hypothetical protein
MRPRWPQTLRDALLSGSVASLVSTAALALCGQRDLRNAATPLNGPSQWVWGRCAPYANGFSARHTLVGYAVHHLASILWALPFEAVRPRRPRGDIAAAALVAATASVVDFELTPQRLRPGFEKRLAPRSLVLVYAAFAAGLALAALARRR